MTSPLVQYHTLLSAGTVTPDAQQERAAQALQKLYDQLKKPHFFWQKPVKGLYLHGGVGRGKSMLMDLFYESIKDHVPARRQHFHEFMLETHDWLHQARQRGREDDLLVKYAQAVSKKTKLVCFDEFHVTDIADAMILSRLFTALFDKGVIVVVTSNWPPERLYEGGLQRARFLPFITLIKKFMNVLALDGVIDYRETGKTDGGNYFEPLSLFAQTRMDRLFLKFTNDAPIIEETLTIKGHPLKLIAGNGIARLSFAQLCEQPRSAEDYLAIAKRYHTVFIDNVPKMGYDRRNELKRFMTLIDVLYDHRIKVYISADAQPDKLYSGDDYAFEFERTISRLTEMQDAGYGKAHA